MSLFVRSSRRTAWSSSSFFHQLNPCWFLQLEIVGDLSSWHWNPGLGSLVWAGTPCSQDIPPKFLSITHGCVTSPFSICASPTSPDGCGFFNSIVIRLLFNSISDSSEGWLFYILVVILTWLCEEVSYVCLCCHLDLK